MKKIFSTIAAIALAAISFTSCEDVPMPYTQPGTEQGGDTGTLLVPQGSGTAADPFNVLGIIEFTKALEADVESQEVYFSGVVTSFKSGEEPGNSYGNATFYIADPANTAKTFYCYRVMGPGNKKFTSPDQLKVGDMVTICGKVVNYKGSTPETAQGKAYVVSVNSEGGNNTGGNDTPSTPGTAKGDGTQANPYNAVAVNALASNLASGAESAPVYFQGKVSRVKEISTQYGNASFYISEDGKTNDEFYVFRCFDLDNQKFTDANKVKVGDDVVLYGPVTNYMGNTPETVGNKCYLVSINSSTGSGNDNTGTTYTPGTSDGLAINGTTVTLTNSAVTAGTETTTLDLASLGLSNGEAVVTVKFPDGTTLTFDANGETNGPKYYEATNGVRVYKNNTMTFAASKAIASIAMECDAYNGTDYVGNKTATVVFSANGAVYNNLYTESTGGGVQLRVKKITITYAK